MNTGRLVAGSLALPVLVTVALAQAPSPLPVLDDKPTPQVDAGGPSAAVIALAFAPAAKGKPPLLVSAATERDGARRFGGLRLWDAAAGKALAERTDLPAKAARPGLAVWHTGPGATEVRVAVAWPEEDATGP